MSQYLTREQIEAIRLSADSGFAPDDDDWNTLCEMALRALSEPAPEVAGLVKRLEKWARDFKEYGVDSPIANTSDVIDDLTLAAQVLRQSAPRKEMSKDN